VFEVREKKYLEEIKIFQGRCIAFEKRLEEEKTFLMATTSQQIEELLEKLEIYRQLLDEAQFRGFEHVTTITLQQEMESYNHNNTNGISQKKTPILLCTLTNNLLALRFYRVNIE
jgi:phosphoribosylaminoimidazole (AIR) synthetase